MPAGFSLQHRRKEGRKKGRKREEKTKIRK
jgi:hypothetical protein